MDVKLNVSTQYQYQRQESRQQTIVERLANATQPVANTQTPERPEPTRRVSLELNGATRDWSSVTSSSTSRELSNKVDNDPATKDMDINIDQKSRALMNLIEKMFHVKVELFDGKALRQKMAQGNQQVAASSPDTDQAGSPAPSSSAPNITRVQQTYHKLYESERSVFQASGEIELNDGRRLAVDFKLDMAREHYEEFFGEMVISGKQVDPLVINLNGNAAQLTNNRQAFDLNSDGQTEKIAYATGDSAFLALDKNNNGKIDDGSELFGPRSGSGFAELAEYDENNDGVIDESDSIFNQLVLSQRDENGHENQLSLKDAGIAGFYLAAYDTPFSIMDDEGNHSGVIRQTGVYIRSDGTLDSMQHVDLVV